MGLPFWMSTAPNPFLLASVCNVDVSFLEKYGRVIFFQNSSFISQNAFSCIAVGLYCMSLASNSQSGVHRSANLGVYYSGNSQVPGNCALSPCLLVTPCSGLSLFSLDLVRFILLTRHAQRMTLYPF